MKSLLHKLLLMSAAIATLPLAAVAADSPPAVFRKNAAILFQGDSITDGGRGRNNDLNHIFGQSYPYLIAANFGAHHPELQLVFMNRGISGNTIPDLAARWQSDTLALKPDVLSILIGVNDVWHNLRDNKPIPFEQMEQIYDQLLTDTQSSLPGVKIILCEPFILPGPATKPRWDEWQADIKRTQGIVEKLAAKHKLPVVHFQKIFDDACRKAPPEYWIWDGVHPTGAGHQLMADEWVRAVKQAWKH